VRKERKKMKKKKNKERNQSKRRCRIARVAFNFPWNMVQEVWLESRVLDRVKARKDVATLTLTDFLQ
jgi:hypothetical protein